MEAVKVLRASKITDPYGNVKSGPLVVHSTQSALVAPVTEGETVEVGRVAETSGFIVYIEGTAPSGILSTDLVEVRSERHKVVGKVNVWYRRNGAFRGETFLAEKVTG